MPGVTTIGSRYANCVEDNSSSAEGAVGYGYHHAIPTAPPPPPPKNLTYENLYEQAVDIPAPCSSNGQQRPADENIYESIDELRRHARYNPSDYDPTAPGCSSSSNSTATAYGRIGNAYGRIDIIGHGIGRIERHLSSSCGSGIDSSHYASFEGGCDSTGRISKVSVQWLLVNKWLPLWIANTDNGRDYRIIDFLLGYRGDYEGIPPQGGASAREEDEESRSEASGEPQSGPSQQKPQE